MKLKIFFIVFFAIFNCKILKEKKHKDFKDKIIDRILA